ncbi:MAG: branched-chain amino acid ABC transporter permease [Alphaproteobacteria bacterium]
MQPLLVLEQGLNGVQFGIMLFLMAAGLTLVFGIMNLINLAHGSFYMIGAYVSAWVFQASGSFLLGIAAALPAALLVGIAVEVGVFRALYTREHLDQVLATFGLILFFNEMVRIIWGPTALYASIPRFLSGQVELLPGVPYPTFRLAIILVGLLVALLLYLLVAKTRLGMLIRAGASNRVMVAALGVNVRLLYTFVFALGAALAAFSGLMAGPIFTVESGMGEGVLILAFVVIVIGGIGSIRGAFVASLLVGIVDTMGRAFLRPLLATFMAPAAADNTGPALASMLIYILMATVLFFRPQGLFPPRGR